MQVRLKAGPVSSYNYVKEGITETLKEVPAEKVISGIPFFTRLWKETPKTEEELKSDKGTDAEQYSATVESDAYGMDNAQAIVKQAGSIRPGIRRPDRTMPHGKQTDPNMRSGWKTANQSKQSSNS